MCIRRVDFNLGFGIFERSASFLEAEVDELGILHVFSGQVAARQHSMGVESLLHCWNHTAGALPGTRLLSSVTLDELFDLFVPEFLHL